MSLTVCWKSPANAEHSLSRFSRLIGAVIFEIEDVDDTSVELVGIAQDVPVDCWTILLVGPGLWTSIINSLINTLDYNLLLLFIMEYCIEIRNDWTVTKTFKLRELWFNHIFKIVLFISFNEALDFWTHLRYLIIYLTMSTQKTILILHSSFTHIFFLNVLSIWNINEIRNMRRTSI